MTAALPALRFETAIAERPRIAVVTNLCTHYRRPLFERVARHLDADFFFTSEGTESYWLRDHTVATGSLSVLPARPVQRLYRSLRDGRYDCIVCGLTGRATLIGALSAARMTSTPLVLWVGLWEHPRTFLHALSRPIVRRVYRSAAAVMVYGSHVAAHVTAESGRQEGVFEVCQAVDNHALRAPLDPVMIREVSSGLGLPPGPVALYVGRLVPEKGLDVLLEAFARAPQVGSLVLAGSGSAIDDLRAVSRRLRIEDRVRFAGYVPQSVLPVYLDVADFLVLPSVSTRGYKEPWGLVINEAMNRRLPVIATDAVGAVAGGLVRHGVNGLVCAQRDAHQLAVAMDELAANPALRARLGSAASATVDLWSVEASAEGFVGAVKFAIARRK
jgi:glycosyltransferase involved in cell wall biosynthesis